MVPLLVPTPVLESRSENRVIVWFLLLASIPHNDAAMHSSTCIRIDQFHEPAAGTA